MAYICLFLYEINEITGFPEAKHCFVISWVVRQTSFLGKLRDKSPFHKDKGSGLFTTANVQEKCLFTTANVQQKCLFTTANVQQNGLFTIANVQRKWLFTTANLQQKCLFTTANVQQNGLFTTANVQQKCLFTTANVQQSVYSPQLMFSKVSIHHS